MKRRCILFLAGFFLAAVTGCSFLEAAPEPTATLPSPSPAVSVPAADTPPPDDDAEIFIVIAEDAVPLLAEPYPNADVLATIPTGDTVTVLRYEGAFAQVQTADGLRGYVPTEYLSREGVSSRMLAGDIYAVYADDFLSLRVSPDASSERLAKLFAGTLLRILETDGGFVRVEAFSYGLRGYVMTDYLSYAVGLQEQPALKSGTGWHAVIGRDAMPLRQEPNPTAQAWLTLEPGTRISVLAHQGRFVKVSVNGRQGYLPAEYVTLLPDGEPRGASDSMYVVCEEFLSLRKSPDTAAPRIKKLSPGDRVRLLGNQGAFSKVTADTGETGFVLSAYLSETKVHTETPLAPQEGAYRVVCRDYLTLRKTPSRRGESLTRLKNGAKVEVQGFEGQYARVSAKGLTGYVLAGYLKAPDASHGLKTVKIKARYAYKTMIADLTTLCNKYSSLTLDEIGESVEGRAIPVVRIGSENARYHILVQGGIHGREHMTSLLLTALIEYTAANQSAAYAGVSAKKLLSDVCLHVMPMTNPDGVVISQTASPTAALKLIRQLDIAAKLTNLSITSYLRAWKSNANGVDLNRNFDAGWAGIDSPAAPSFSRYKGGAPHDQPETQALARYTQSYDFNATISYHAFGSSIFWEYGDGQAVNVLSKDLGFALRACTQYPLSGASGLDAGGYKDWAATLGIPSVTVEIGTRACPLPVEEFSTIWARNKKTFLAAARWVKR